MAEIKLKIASVVIGSGEGGGSGVAPYYADLPDKPSINGETLSGDMTSEDLGLASESQAVPSGGTTGQVLAKKSNADNDVQWVNQQGGGAGVEDAVRYGTSQNLTDAQKVTARNNIGAAGSNYLRVLFIGNSTMLDSVGYLPAVLRNAKPNINVTIGMAYIAGSSIAQHLAFISKVDSSHKVETTIENKTIKCWYDQNATNPGPNPGDTYPAPYRRETTIGQDTTEEGFAGYRLYISENFSAWDDRGTKTAENILKVGQWDVIVLQDVPVNSGWTNIARYLYPLMDVISNIIEKEVTFAWMRTHVEADTNPNMREHWITCANIDMEVMRQTGISMFLTPGTAIQNLRQINTIAALGQGTHGNLCVDNVHLQEGIGPLCASYALAIGILDSIGANYKSIIGEKTEVTASFLNSLHVPGQNLGNPQEEGAGIIGFDNAASGNENRLLAQIAAVEACKHPFWVIKPSLDNSTAGRVIFRADIDDEPKNGSKNPISSGGVYTALEGKVNTSDISTNIETDATSETKAAAPKAVKTYVDSKVSSVYKAAGSVANVSSLPTLIASNIGKVCNMTSEFTTTSDFVEGSGKTYPAGTNVAVVEHTTGVYKYDVLAGFVNLSGKQDALSFDGTYDATTNKVATEITVDNAVADKVDKEQGKGLSTNDYDNTEKMKVAGAVQSITRGGSPLPKEDGVVEIPEEIEEVAIIDTPSSGTPDVDLTNGTLTFHIPRGADGHNPNLGTFDISNLSNAPTPTEDGDYIVVIDVNATSPRLQKEIYLWDGDSWEPTGEAPTATFASCQVVSNVSIVDDLTTGGVDDVLSAEQGKVLNQQSIYDVTAHNPNAGTNNDGKWESISALLSDANLNTLIPTSVRKGGMSIKFVQSSDNKYVQYFLTKNEWSASESDWEKINIENEIKRRWRDFLVGKNISICGDSISTFSGYCGENSVFYPYGNVQSVEDTWWYKFIIDTGGTLKENISFAGARVTDNGVNQSLIPLMDSAQSTDIMFVEGGVNDSASAIVIGTLDISKETSDLNDANFADAYLHLVRIAMQKATEVILVITDSVGNNYANVIITIAEYYGLRYVDMRDHVVEKAHTSHPSKNGMMLMASCVIDCYVDNKKTALAEIHKKESDGAFILNISEMFPNGGTDGTNIYTRTAARSAVPVDMRVQGVIICYASSYGFVIEQYIANEYNSSTFVYGNKEWNTINNNTINLNTIHNYKTDAFSDGGTARSNIPECYRGNCLGLIIMYLLSDGWYIEIGKQQSFSTSSTAWERIVAGNKVVIIDGAITSDKIANNAVITDKINEGAVTLDKIASSAKNNKPTYNSNKLTESDGVKRNIEFYGDVSYNTVSPLDLSVYIPVKGFFDTTNKGQWLNHANRQCIEAFIPVKPLSAIVAQMTSGCVLYANFYDINSDGDWTYRGYYASNSTSYLLNIAVPSNANAVRFAFYPTSPKTDIAASDVTSTNFYISLVTADHLVKASIPPFLIPTNAEMYHVNDNGGWRQGSGSSTNISTNNIITARPIKVIPGHRYAIESTNTYYSTIEMKGGATPDIINTNMFNAYGLGSGGGRYSTAQRATYVIPSGIHYINLILTERSAVGTYTISPENGESMDFRIVDITGNLMAMQRSFTLGALHTQGQQSVVINGQTVTKYAQGMTIANGYIFQGYSTGEIEVYDYDTMEYISTFVVNYSLHMGQLDFGAKYSDEDEFGQLFVSDKGHLYVYRIIRSNTTFTATLVDTITIPDDDNYADAYISDIAGNNLILIRYEANPESWISAGKALLTQYKASGWTSGATFTKQEEIEYPKYGVWPMQSGIFRDGKLYLVCGSNESNIRLYCFDFELGEPCGVLDLRRSAFDIGWGDEPQAICIYDGRIILSTTYNFYELIL